MDEDLTQGFDDSTENIVRELRATFREEANELLAELESALLELEKDPGDQEQIGRAFRIMHTIKGSGGAIQPGVAPAIEKIVSRCTPCPKRIRSHAAVRVLPLPHRYPPNPKR